MPSYAQWRSAADKGQLARVVWLCGDQRILVEEVIEETKRLLNISEFDYVPLSGETNSAREIWDAAYQYSLDPDANRLVLVREADKITDWSQLKKWFAYSRKLVTTYIIFVSDEAEYPVVPDTQKPVLVEHVDLIRAKGKTVRCSLPSTGELISWILRNSKLTEDTAKFLLDRSGGDMHIISNMCRKSMMFKADPGKKIVEQMSAESAGQEFSDALIAQDKNAAMLAIEKIPEAEYSKIVSKLYSRLDVLHVLHKAMPNFNNVREMSEATGVKIFLIQKYGQVSRVYDPVKLSQCRNVLTIVDDAVQRNATAGALELLVTLW